MATYMVTYDLGGPSRDYESLHTLMKAYGTYCPLTESTWLIVTEQATGKVVEKLQPALDSNDKLAVIAVTSPGTWNGFTIGQTDWMKKYL